jgi:ribosomal-protein-alanine N-acetyltransferase
MYGPIVEGHRIRLMPPTPESIPTFLRWFSDVRVTHYLLVRNPLSIPHEAEWLEGLSRDASRVFWSVRLKGQGEELGRLVGNCGLHDLDWRHRRAMFGLVIGEPDQWGNGYGTDVARLVLAYAFRELGLEKVTSCVILPNEASRRLHLTAGYQECGMFRRHLWFRGQWHDEWRAEVLRDEWEANHGARVKWPLE